VCVVGLIEWVCLWVDFLCCGLDLEWWVVGGPLSGGRIWGAFWLVWLEGRAAVHLFWVG
jgi:hypothetical protein